MKNKTKILLELKDLMIESDRVPSEVLYDYFRDLWIDQNYNSNVLATSRGEIELPSQKRGVIYSVNDEEVEDMVNEFFENTPELRIIMNAIVNTRMASESKALKEEQFKTAIVNGELEKLIAEEFRIKELATQQIAGFRKNQIERFFKNRLVLSSYEHLPELMFVCHSKNTFSLYIGEDDFSFKIEDEELICDGHGAFLCGDKKRKKDGSYKDGEEIPYQTEKDKVEPIKVNLPI